MSDDTTPRLDDLANTGDLRALAELLLETHRVEYVDGGVVLVMAPAGFEHRRVIESIVDDVKRAYYTGVSPTHWRTHSENFKWNLPGGSEKFYVPDLVVVRPGGTRSSEEREGIELIVEVTSPKSPDTVFNDSTAKPRQYALGGVPLYLMVDQKNGTWTLHHLPDGERTYQVLVEGAYGEKSDPIPLPTPFGFALQTGAWPTYTGLDD
ncbi:Uma2 family endonuclease [Yinghuangia seranimata]|uniref:Uma2 family endonuclease n=1 Tax=Yinghuangia seranimata TaxID=408067 RepID=UPI00248B0311|nr:Uma2 family endonuclease [Yinghuangia seranimata]MDI2126708.1 Uma2 family endonuclease [Yinghuangia seranimata]